MVEKITYQAYLEDMTSPGMKKLEKQGKKSFDALDREQEEFIRNNKRAGRQVGNFSRVMVAKLGAIGASYLSLRKIAQSVDLFDVQAKAEAQVQAGIESTNAIAGRSLAQLKAQASELQKVTLFGDEQTLEAQSILLTFTGIRKEILDRTTPAVLDLATRMKTDAKSAAIQLGKALNDPATGLTMLTRSGITFSEKQKEVIKHFQQTNQLGKAQAVILKEVETQFGGSAKAAARAGKGPLTQLNNTFGDLLEVIGENSLALTKDLAPSLTRITETAMRWIQIPVSDKMEDERVQANFLAMKLMDLNTTEEDRKTILEELKTISPDIVSGLNQEKIETAQLTSNLRKYNQETLNKIILQKKQEEIDKAKMRRDHIMQKYGSQEAYVAGEMLKVVKYYKREDPMLGAKAQEITEGTGTIDEKARAIDALGAEWNQKQKAAAKPGTKPRSVYHSLWKAFNVSGAIKGRMDRANEVVEQLKKEKADLAGVLGIDLNAKGDDSDLFTGGVAGGGGGGGSPTSGSALTKIGGDNRKVTNLTINIDRQIETLNIHSETLEEGIEGGVENLRRALLTVVNDINHSVN